MYRWRGKQVLGIRVVSMQTGGPIGYRKSFVRTLVRSCKRPPPVLWNRCYSAGVYRPMIGKIVVLALVLLTACGSNQMQGGLERQPRAINPAEPCSLLAADQMARALELRVDKVREAEGHPDPTRASSRLCVYETERPYESVTLSFRSPVSKSQFQKVLNTDPVNTDEIYDVGDRAFVHAGVQLVTLVSDVLISVTVQNFNTIGETKVALKGIAVAAVREIPRGEEG